MNKPFLYLRIDDRLIHGQIVAGWIEPLEIKFVFLANDRIVEDTWEQEAYRLAVPNSINIFFYGIDEAVPKMKNLKIKDKAMIIVENLSDAYRILKNGLRPDESFIGGIHSSDERKPYLSYIYLNQKDLHYIKNIRMLGISLYGLQLPGSEKINIYNLVEKKL